MSKKINISLIKQKKVYTTQTLAELLNVHVRTIQVWKKEGMQPLENDTRPFLFLGLTVKEFLRKKLEKSKKKLKINQFYCLKCRKETESKAEELQFIITEKELGNGNKHAKITGKCKVCGTSLFRFSSDKGIEKMISLKLLTEGGTGLCSNSSTSLNTDISRVSKRRVSEQLSLNF